MIGTVEKIMRFPVKSMMGESVEKGVVQYSGLQGDRVFAFVDEAKKGDFPWLTARQFKQLILYRPSWIRPDKLNVSYPNTNNFEVTVTTPAGLTYGINSAELLEELEKVSERKLYLRFSESGMQDARPISLISQQTLQHIQAQSDISMNSQQFRMNFYVNWINGNAFYEEKLIGKKIKIGERVVLEINKKDQRCAIVNIDPSTARVRPETLRYIAQQLNGCLGVYAIVVREGIVKARDEIHLLET